MNTTPTLTPHLFKHILVTGIPFFCTSFFYLMANQENNIHVNVHININIFQPVNHPNPPPDNPEPNNSRTRNPPNPVQQPTREAPFRGYMFSVRRLIHYLIPMNNSFLWTRLFHKKI
ncbi:hypothetical protein Hanom_Chr08g00721351 [Helianthus anomalus]